MVRTINRGANSILFDISNNVWDYIFVSTWIGYPEIWNPHRENDDLFHWVLTFVSLATISNARADKQRLINMRFNRNG
jgi:hypothetical protein